MNTTTISYKEVFQLAQDKGYKPEFTVNLEQIEINSQFGADYSEEGRYIDLCLIQKWLRDEHKIEIAIDWNKFYPSTPYQYTARPQWREQPVRPYGHGGMAETYELALLKGINEALKLIP